MHEAMVRIAPSQPNETLVHRPSQFNGSNGEEQIFLDPS
jgi:hypothetical protein